MFLISKKNMGNAWLDFVKAYRKKHPGLSLKDTLKKASVEYKKKPTKKVKKKGKAKKKK